MPLLALGQGCPNAQSPQLCTQTCWGGGGPTVRSGEGKPGPWPWEGRPVTGPRAVCLGVSPLHSSAWSQTDPLAILLPPCTAQPGASASLSVKWGQRLFPVASEQASGCSLAGACRTCLPGAEATSGGPAPQPPACRPPALPRTRLRAPHGRQPCSGSAHSLHLN